MAYSLRRDMKAFGIATKFIPNKKIVAQQQRSWLWKQFFFIQNYFSLGISVGSETLQIKCRHIFVILEFFFLFSRGRKTIAFDTAHALLNSNRKITFLKHFNFVYILNMFLKLWLCWGSTISKKSLLLEKSTILRGGREMWKFYLDSGYCGCAKSHLAAISKKTR